MGKRINNYSKMRRTNSHIREFLKKKGVTNIFFAPHTRFVKDFEIDDVKFDGLATLDGSIIFFQAKTNQKPPKSELVKYIELEKKYGIMCWLLVKYDGKSVELF